MPKQEMVDLEDLIKKWVNKFPMDKKHRENADEILPTDINWKHVRISHGETIYKEQTHRSKPKSHILFTAHFTNNTEQSQVYSLKTERRTNSICALSVENGFCYGASMELKLVPPNPIIEANAGFHGELSVSKLDEETFTEELVWSVDNQVSVPPGFKTRADLVIREEEYVGEFTSETCFHGIIHVTLRNKKDQTTIITINGPVEEVFTAKGFKCDKEGVKFINKGKCRCRFGIEQHISLTQETIEKSKEAIEDSKEAIEDPKEAIEKSEDKGEV